MAIQGKDRDTGETPQLLVIPSKVQSEEQPAHVDDRSNQSSVVCALVASSAAKKNTEGRSSVKPNKNPLEQSTKKKLKKPCLQKEKILVNSSKKLKKEPSVDNGSNPPSVVFALMASSALKEYTERRSSVKSNKNPLEQSTRGKLKKPYLENEKTLVKFRKEHRVKPKSAKDHRASFLSIKSTQQGEQHNNGAIRMELEHHPSKETALSVVTSLGHEGDRDGKLPSPNLSSAIVKYQEIPLPFTKSSFLWEYFDSLQVFQCLPQNPHFQPLLECSETSWEALAITHMLSFVNLVEKASNLRLENPTSDFDSCLGGLSDLEMFGFNVKPVVNCVKELLSLKTRQELLDNSWTNIHEKIAESNSKIAKFEEEINGIDKMISELEEQRAVKASLKLKEDLHDDFLQNCASIIKDNMFDLKQNFENKVAGLGRLL